MIIDSFVVGGFQIVVNDSIKLIKAYTQALAPCRLCVDIGAGDGLSQSNSLMLFMEGWQGLALEADAGACANMERFYSQYLPWVQRRQCRVTPDNLAALLAEAGIPADFGFLSLDIDSYDYAVLETLLQNCRPSLICAEINEKIPPPLRFRVNYDPGHVYTGDHFYGQSLQSLQDLANQYNYDLISLCFNNAFLVARECNLWPVKSPALIYAEGYLSGPLPEYNRNLHHLQRLSPEAGLAALNEHFAAYAGRYRAGLRAE